MVIFRNINTDKLDRIKNQCERQYKVEVEKIHTLYVYGGKIKGVDFVTKQGVEHIASNTATCDKIVHVLNNQTHTICMECSDVYTGEDCPTCEYYNK